ncbi:MAG: OB-fold domain-containing protein [Deltaproteobacteria bacterium]|nr:OB-fold domain-containing protein [Deltaproteobacteria bacterium]
MTSPRATREELERRLATYVGAAAGPPEVGRDPVDGALVRQWCDALDDRNPAYLDEDAARASTHGGLVAPPAMLQAWVLPGISMSRAAADPENRQRELHALFDAQGYTGVVATNCEQAYDRYLRPGDRVTGHTVIESISGEKATGLGSGYFIDTRTTFRDQHGGQVGWMTFRVLKFKPAAPPAAARERAAPPKPRRLRPALGHDNAWWWDGLRCGELLIQRCKSCGQLRHPPRPMCGACQSTQWDTLASGGRGSVYSFVVMHHPQVPGYEYPLVVVLVDLDEGTRLISNLVGVAPGDVHIGMRVEARIEDVDPELALPLFRRETSAGG